MKNILDEKKSNKKKVKFSNIKIDQAKLSLSKFISCFEQNISNTSTSSPTNLEHSDYSKKRFYELNKTIGFLEKKQLGSFIFASILHQDAIYDAKFIRKFLKIMPLKKMGLLDLIFHAWLSQDFQNSPNLYKLIYLLSGCASHLNNSDYDVEILTPVADDTNDFLEDFDQEQDIDDFENNFIGDYLPKYKSISENSNSLVESLLLTWIIRSILIQVCHLRLYIS